MLELFVWGIHFLPIKPRRNNEKLWVEFLKKRNNYFCNGLSVSFGTLDGKGIGTRIVAGKLGTKNLKVLVARR